MLGSPVRASRAVGGGSICEARRLQLADGRSIFVKEARGAPPGLFPAEAEGLAALGAAGGPRVPAVLAVEERFLALEDLGAGRASKGDWEHFGHALARLHRQSAEGFGFAADNFIGRTPQPNGWMADGPTFFAERRLLHLGRACRDERGLDRRTLQALESIARRLPELLPDEPPALLHGDLWTGNVHPCASGEIALIDPAAHFGYREADLAMTSLFGSLPAAFHAAYESAWPLAPGARERVSLFNLYHLLNHLLLFGGGYRASVEQTARRWA
ncbi:MAG: fructosamine kinase family protein [Deltaproteobacteria bacterium]|nr:fructosamine kinase family protein [Deltaproteobacteria bacterium]